MAIFDEIRGLVPLPRSKKTANNTQGGGVVDNRLGDNGEVLSPAVPIPLPDFPNFDTGNTTIDRVFTAIDDVFNFVNLPTPAVVDDIFGVTQRVEDILSDPNAAIRQLVDRSIYSLLRPDEILVEGPSGPYMSKPEGKQFTEKNSRLVTESEALLEEDELLANRVFKGRDTVKNLTLRQTDLWDIKIEPYIHRGVPNTWVPPISVADQLFGFTNEEFRRGALLTNTNTRYKEKTSANLVINESMYPATVPIISDYMPIQSFDIDLKSLTTKSVEMFGGSVITVPDLIKYNSRLSFQVLEDENKRWRRWFQTYAENLYRERDTSVAPYKNSSLLVTVYQYRQDYKILSKNKFICTLGDYQVVSSGSGTASVEMLSISLSIVGRIDLPLEKQYLQII